MDTPNLWIQEEHIEVRNRGEDNEERIRCGESGVYETQYQTVGSLFHSLMSEHGRCVSKVYIDGPSGDAKDAKQIGWTFEKIAHYEDTYAPYLKETWVTVHTAPPKRTVTFSYRYL